MAHMAHKMKKTKSDGTLDANNSSTLNIAPEVASSSNQGSKLSLNCPAETDADRRSSIKTIDRSEMSDSASNTLDRPERKKRKEKKHVKIDIGDDDSIQLPPPVAAPASVRATSSDRNNNSRHNSMIKVEVPMLQVTAPQSPSFMYSPGVGPSMHPLMMTPSGLTPSPIPGTMMGPDGMVLDADQEVETIIDPVTGESKTYIVDDEFNLPVSLALLILILYMMGGALIFTFTDGWTFFDAFYFVFISISTIGFGDLTPDSDLSMIAAIIYLLFGLALTSMCINVIQEKLAKGFEEAKMRLGTRIGFDVENGAAELGVSDPNAGPADAPSNGKEGEEEKLRRKAKAESEERRKRREAKKRAREESADGTDRNGTDRNGTERSNGSKGRKSSKDSNGDRKEKEERKSREGSSAMKENGKKEGEKKENGKKDKEPKAEERKKKKKEKEEMKYPVTFVEAKQTAPLMTFRFSDNQLGAGLKDRRKKKMAPGVPGSESSPPVFKDVDDMMAELSPVTTSTDDPSSPDPARPSPPASIKSDYQDATDGRD